MLKNKNINHKKGFTIIEVVLVLAIAGLIFLMVFVALPTLQASQRDTQRRNDLARVATAITQYQTNNNGNLPTKAANGASTVGTFVKNYLGGANFVDPDGTYYTVQFKQNDGSDFNVTSAKVNHIIYVQTKAKCKGETAVSSSNAREYAILYKLEGSGVYCQDNQ